MQAVVLWASSRDTTNDKGENVNYSNVAVIPLEAAKDDRKAEGGYRPIEFRCDRDTAISLRDAVRSAGPLVAELELVPEIFGKMQSLRCTSAKAIAKLEQVKITPRSITPLK